MVLELNYSRPEASAGSRPLPSGEGIANHLAGKRVVIVEDEALTVMQLRRILRAGGMDVVGAAANGRQGVETVLREHPDIVLMDINMPVMNGLDAAKELLDTSPTCIVMLTAYSDPGYVEAAVQMGAAGYVVKPIDSRSLMPHLEQAFQRFQDSAGAA